jgi:hypothetical protein
MSDYLRVIDLKKRLAELEDIKKNESVDGSKNYLDELEISELEELYSLCLDSFNDNDQLIIESEFVDYCKNMLEDLDYVSPDVPGFVVIDWEQTAENLKLHSHQYNHL